MNGRWSTGQRRRSALVLALAIVSTGVALVAQAPAPASEAASKDPFGRDTPRGTLLGFMRAARDGNIELMPMFLNTPLTGEAAVALARQLHVVLDSRLPARLDEVSDRPEGRLAHPLRPDQDVVATITTKSGELEIVLERVTRPKSPPVWLFSRRTLAAVPEAFDDVSRIAFEPMLPPVLVKPRIAGVRLFHWIALCVVLPVAYRMLAFSIARVTRVASRWNSGQVVAAALTRVSGALGLLIVAAGIAWLVGQSELPFVERQFWSIVAAMLTLGAGMWLLLILNGYGERYLLRRVQHSGFGDVASLVRLMRRFADGVVIVVVLLIAVRRFGGDPTAALAGLGIGGIAVALAAQKTLENVIGGLSLIFDRAVRVGDFLKLGDCVGTVDSIGLRSTRIRTLDRSVLSVPNSQIANVNVETLSSRDAYWFHHIIGVRYDSTTGQMRAVVNGIRRKLLERGDVDAETVRVRFLRFGQSSLDIEVSAYIRAPGWEQFLEVQEELLLAIMEIVEASDTAIALPSRTLQLDVAAAPVAGQTLLAAPSVRH
jgi:MscS family membrane protein